MSPPRVALVDQNGLVRAALRCWLERELKADVVGEAGSEAEALRLIQRAVFDVLILEANLPGCDRVAQEAAIANPPVRMLVLSDSCSEGQLQMLQRYDICGCLLKSDRPKFFLEALQGVVQGETGWLSPKLAGLLTSKTEVEQAWSTLTQREREVVQLVAQGLSNQEIAEEVCLSVGRVKNCISTVLRKLGKRNRFELICWVQQQGRPVPSSDSGQE